MGKVLKYSSIFLKLLRMEVTFFGFLSIPLRIGCFPLSLFIKSQKKTPFLQYWGSSSINLSLLFEFLISYTSKTSHSKTLSLVFWSTKSTFISSYYAFDLDSLDSGLMLNVCISFITSSSSSCDFIVTTFNLWFND